jgi:hypothetical protein
MGMDCPSPNLGTFCHKINGTDRPGDILSRGHFVQGTDRPGDGSSRGRIVQGTDRPGDGSLQKSRGQIVRVPTARVVQQGVTYAADAKSYSIYFQIGT